MRLTVKLSAGFILCTLLLAPATLRADRLVKVDGTVVERATVQAATFAKIEYTLEGISARQELKGEEVSEIIWENLSSALRRGMGALETGNPADAVTALQSYRNRSSKQRVDDGLGHLLLGRAYLELGASDPARIAEAVTSLDGSIKVLREARDFYLPHCLEELARAHQAQGNHAAADKLFDDLAGGTYGPRWAVAARHGKARGLLAQGQFDGARSAFGPLRSEGDPNQQVQAQLGYARAQFGQKQYDAAAKTVRDDILKTSAARPMSFDRSTAEAFILWGDAEREAGARDWALIRYLRAEAIATQLGDVHAEALYKAARLCKELGHTDKAERLRDQLVRLHPGSPWNKD